MHTRSFPLMKQVILPTAYLPPVAYMSAMAVSALCLLDLRECYIRQSWRNRSTIMAANGMLNLIVPVLAEGKSSGMKRVSARNPWQRHHWKSIASAYGKAPFFIHYRSLVEGHYSRPFRGKLADWNQSLLQALTQEFIPGLRMEIMQGDEKWVDQALDLRSRMSPKSIPPEVPGSFPVYHQVFSDRHGFVPNLGILDLVFNLGPGTTDYLKECGKVLMNQIKAG